MRELKFRAWANGYGKWCHSIEYMGDGLWLGYVDDGIGELSTTDIIVEQYTGLKDKNEKEIYEGDIVKLVGDVADNKCRLYQVYYRKSKARYWLMPLEVFKSDIGVFEEVEMSERFEAIGTIHEYPKLLKEKK